MKRILLFLFLFNMQTGMASEPPAIKRNLIILIDPNHREKENEPLDSSLQAATKFTHDAIIITTANIFSNILNLGPLLRDTLNKFNISIQERSGLVVIIPKELKTPYGIHQQRPASSELVKQLVNKVGRVQDLLSLFDTTQKSIEWYMAMMGHGTYTTRGAIGTFNDLVALYNLKRYEQGFIAGIKVEDFQDLLRFFNTNITTKALYFNSCYVGDLNLALILSNFLFISSKGSTIRAGVNPKFTLIAGALTGAPTMAPGNIERQIAVSS